MASIDTIVDSFIAENELDSEIKPALQGLVNKCFEGVFKHIYSVPIPNTDGTSKTKTQKVLKADKIEDPTDCETREQLHNCTTKTLNDFCKKQNLKVGGNKTEAIDRVWRHLQGTGSEEDKSSRNKPKASKKVPEKHQCSGCNAKGEKCAVVGTECFPDTDHWFCWRHIVDAEEFITKLEDPSQPKPKERAPKAPKKPKDEKTETKKSKKASKKPEPELEADSDSEPEPEPVKKPKAKAVPKKSTLFEDDSDSETKAEVIKPVPKKASKAEPVAKKASKKIPVPPPESDSEESEESEAESDQDSEDERKAYYSKLAKEALEEEEATEFAEDEF
jgi:hypothetical protein